MSLQTLDFCTPWRVADAHCADHRMRLFRAVEALGQRDPDGVMRWREACARRLVDVPGLEQLVVGEAAQGGLCLRLQFSSDSPDDLVSGINVLGPLLDWVGAHAQGFPLRHLQPHADYWAALWSLCGDAAAPISPRLSFERSRAGPAALPAMAAARELEAIWSALEGDWRSPEGRGVLGEVFAFFSPESQAAGSEWRSRLHHAREELGAWATRAHENVVRAIHAVMPSAGMGPPQHVARTKSELMHVISDEAHYSVCGYRPRMEGSIGLIYLGLDASDPRYGAWSEAANAAAHAVSEREGFEHALAATQAVIAERGSAGPVGPLIDDVLARLCTHWFGIPDGQHIKAGGSFLRTHPPACPGQFAPPSGYIFQPQPGIAMKMLGELDGHGIVQGALAYVRDMHAAGARPSGSIGRALFDRWPAPGDELQLAQTLVGVMMGFLPTAQGNLGNVFKALDATALASLRASFQTHPASDWYARADQVLRAPLMAAMQRDPVPPQIWRTATAPDQWPDAPGHTIATGDRVAVDIQAVTQADLAAGVQDVTAVFGGNRDLSGHPTHACPGMWMAMGVFLGVMAGVLGAPQQDGH